MTKSEPEPDQILTRLEEENGIIYNRTNRSVEFTHAKNDTQHFIDAVAFLLNEGCVTEGDLPYMPGPSSTRYIVNTNPTHQDGRDMIRPTEVVDGVYVETNHDSDSKKRYIRYMIDEFVLE